MADQDQDQEQALLARLQSQFGDLDVSRMLAVPAQAGEATAEEEDGGSVVPSEESSSVEDPTPEELRRWQEAQYKMARWGGEGKAAAGGDGAGGTSAEEVRPEEHRRRGAADLWHGGEAEAYASESTAATASAAASATPSAAATASATATATAFFSPPAVAGGGGSSDGDILAQLVEIEPTLHGKWTRLYSSNVDGLSYASLVASVRGFDGPTVLLVGAVPSHASGDGGTGGRDRSGGGGGTIGFYTSTAWRESDGFYGSHECLLFGIHRVSGGGEGGGREVLRTYRPLPKAGTSKPAPGAAIDSLVHEIVSSNVEWAKCDGRYQSLHSTVAAAVHGVGVGVGVGGRSGPGPGPGAEGVVSSASPAGLSVGGRLHLTETLEGCQASLRDGTYEAGPLLPRCFGGDGGGDFLPDFFDVDVMEAWAVGDEGRIRAAMEARGKDRANREASRLRSQRVDRTQFVDHFRSSVVGARVFDHVRYTSGATDDDFEPESEGALLSQLEDIEREFDCGP